MPAITISQLGTQLSKDSKTFAAGIRNGTRRALKQAADPLENDMRESASWSRRIPHAIKLQVRFGSKKSSVKILVDPKLAPHAAPLEVGTSNAFSEDFINQHGGFRVVNGRRVAVRHQAYKEAREAGASARVNRHPVYAAKGSKRYQNKADWVNQPTRPFFFPTIKKDEPQTDAVMDTIITEAALAAGFRRA